MGQEFRGSWTRRYFGSRGTGEGGQRMALLSCWLAKGSYQAETRRFEETNQQRGSSPKTNKIKLQLAYTRVPNPRERLGQRRLHATHELQSTRKKRHSATPTQPQHTTATKNKLRHSTRTKQRKTSSPIPVPHHSIHPRASAPIGCLSLPFPPSSWPPRPLKCRTPMSCTSPRQPPGVPPEPRRHTRKP